MNADGGVYAFLRAGEVHAPAAAFHVVAGDDEAGEAGQAGAIDHRLPVTVELRVLKMAVRVDQHQAPSLATSSSTLAGSSFLNSGWTSASGCPGAGATGCQPSACSGPSLPRYPWTVCEVNGRYGEKATFKQAI